MTKEEFFKIVDSGDSESYSNNPEFISFAKQAKEEYNQSKNQKRLEKQKEIAKAEKAVIDLIEKNKDSIPNIKTLSINTKCDKDVYEDMLDSQEGVYLDYYGNVLVCQYDIDNLELKVKGMYQNVKAINFNNEIVFVTNGQTFNALGDGDDTAGDDTLEGLLSYLESDILDPNIKIDKNIFNTGANYFLIL
jgi:23S rRNA G2069 N7-methylase RlmK/C1962 C5-methylase RlmI